MYRVAATERQQEENGHRAISVLGANTVINRKSMNMKSGLPVVLRPGGVGRPRLRHDRGLCAVRVRR